MITREIFVDGACIQNPGPGGWAVYVIYKSIVIYGNATHTTNNAMELQGLLHALKYIMASQDTNEKNFTVYTDSAYVSNGYNTWLIDWQKNNWINSTKQIVKNKDIWQQISSCKDVLSSNSYSMRCLWISRNSNKIADKYARKGAHTQQLLLSPKIESI